MYRRHRLCTLYGAVDFFNCFVQWPVWMGGRWGCGAGRLGSLMQLSVPSRAIKFLYAPAPPPPTVWALKPPSWALVHKTTNAPMIYNSLCVILLMRAASISSASGRGWALEISIFLGPKWHSPIGSIHYTGSKKLLISRAQTPHTCPHNGCWPHQKHYTQGHINHRCKNSYLTRPPSHKREHYTVVLCYYYCHSGASRVGLVLGFPSKNKKTELWQISPSTEYIYF
jgi:hypothetical protein